MKDMNYSNQ